MNFFDYARKQLEHGFNNYSKDLNILSEQDILHGREKARPVSGMTYELILINQRSVKRFKGETPDPWPFGDNDWATWPGNPTKAEIIAAFEASGKEVLEAYDQVGEANATKDIATDGPPTNAIKVALFVFMHVMYHCAQLNYIQQMDGDMAVHWS